MHACMHAQAEWAIDECDEVGQFSNRMCVFFADDISAMIFFESCVFTAGTGTAVVFCRVV